ncbi:hypothetical protein Tco_0031769 [Tanacetum coccineum]
MSYSKVPLIVDVVMMCYTIRSAASGLVLPCTLVVSFLVGYMVFLWVAHCYYWSLMVTPGCMSVTAGSSRFVLALQTVFEGTNRLRAFNWNNLLHGSEGGCVMVSCQEPVSFEYVGPRGHFIFENVDSLKKVVILPEDMLPKEISCELGDTICEIVAPEVESGPTRSNGGLPWPFFTCLPGGLPLLNTFGCNSPSSPSWLRFSTKLTDESENDKAKMLCFIIDHGINETVA